MRLVVILHVPYPLSLSYPAVPAGFTEQKFRRFASQASVPTRVEVYLCRDHRSVLREHLDPGSLVVLGARRWNWWWTQERRLVRWLQEHGHSVVLAAPEEEAVNRPLYNNVMQFRMPNSSH